MNVRDRKIDYLVWRSLFFDVTKDFFLSLFLRDREFARYLLWVLSVYLCVLFFLPFLNAASI